MYVVHQHSLDAVQACIFVTDDNTCYSLIEADTKAHAS